MIEPHTPGKEGRSGSSNKKVHHIVLNVLIAVLVVVVGFLSYSLIERNLISPPVDPTRSDVSPGKIIQVDVLNGCGVSGAASTLTSYLRARGFDVVEMRNYKTFDVDESLVVDRTGELETARKVAYALGIKQKNIVRQLNADYYVDVSIVIGKDYSSLKPYQ